MKKKLIVLMTIFFVVTAACWIWPDQEMSDAERRKLAQKPSLTPESVLNGSFMSDFESYTLDQFPLRDSLRSLKALAEYKLFLKKDNNELYEADGYVAKILYPYDANSVSYAAKKFGEIYENFLKGNCENIYAAVIPDKGYYLAYENGYPNLDHNQLVADLFSAMGYAKMLPLNDTMKLTDFYKTDSHWRQEELLDVMKYLAGHMNLTEAARLEDFAEEKVATEGFYGVYYGQSALPLKPETIRYLTWDGLEDCIVYNYELGREVTVYQPEKLEGRDPYDFYLGGAAALITVENPQLKAEGNDRELILFRDSFGSSIAPLFLADYSKVTLVDIRYMQSSMLDQYIEFDGQDVLFLYGASMINNSFTFK